MELFYRGSKHLSKIPQGKNKRFALYHDMERDEENDQINGLVGEAKKIAILDKKRRDKEKFDRAL
jgi:hypothetical protein